MRRFFVLILPLLSVACGRSEPPAWDFGGCDSLDPRHCMLPWPSDYHAVPDDGTETGWRLALDVEHLPVNIDAVRTDPTFWNERDGFSIGSPAMAAFGALDRDGLPDQHSIEQFASDDVRSILLDAETGLAVAHWVEVDAHATAPEDRLTLLWSAQALEFNHRYIVAFRNLTRDGGRAVPVSDGFVALRDGGESDDAEVEARRDHYEADIFPLLEQAGFPRGELTLAWDFHTSSRGSALGRMEHLRDEGLAQAGAGGPPYRLLDVEENDCSDPEQVIWKSVRGRFTVPSYTTTPTIDSVLTRGGDGLPYAEGTREPAFIVRVPCSLQRDPGPAYLLQYGHGLLGDESEAKTGWLSRFIDDNRMIVVASRWTGMSSEDYPAIALMLVQDLGRFAIIPERSQQGFLEQALLLRLATGALADDPELAVEGVPLIQPGVSEIGWYGISQGGILGGAYVALSPDLDRAVLGVGGAPYALLLPRSEDFSDFFKILETMYPDELEQMWLISGLFGQLWDVGETVAWSHDLALDPNKRVLSQIALGDAQVHVEGSRYQARSIGATLLTPAVEEVWGLETSSGPVQGSAYAEWAYGAPVAPDSNLPPDKAFDTHECVRRTPAAQAQVVEFLTTGTAAHACDGPCIFTREDGC